MIKRLISLVSLVHKKIFSSPLLHRVLPEPKRPVFPPKFAAGGSRALHGALLTLLPLLGLTMWLGWSAHDQVVQAARERFAFKVKEAQFAVEQRLVAYEQVLHGVVGLFEASDDVQRHEWRAYVKALNIDKNYPGIQGIGFAMRIRPAELQAHIRTIRTEGFPEYAVRPAGERAEYTSIIYLQPFDWRNQRAFGYDMFSEPVRREAMIRARDTGLPSVSGKLTLVQETNRGVQHGFLLYLPVYRRGVALETAEQRQDALRGYVYSPFRMDDLMQGTLGPATLPRIRLRIFDGTVASPESLMHDSAAASPEMPHAPSYQVDETFEINGRKWTMRFTSLPAFDAAIDIQRPRLILLGGILVSLLFAVVVWSLSLNRARARALVDANGELHRAKDAAEAANRAKSDFLANLSHELRTPLTLILAPLEQMLSAQCHSAESRAQLERVQRNALLLLNRVNDILDFSRAEAGKFEPRWEAVNLATLIPGLAEDAAAAAAGKGCSLSWQIDPTLGTVCVDHDFFEKILLNFVSNAIKFTPVGGRILIEAAGLDEKRFELSVTDSGIGVPRDKVALLFKRFEQVDASVTRQYGGSGIGLALVKELAELMGGSVGVESEPGQGARFFVRLPRGIERLAAVAPNTDGAALQARIQPETALRRVRFQEAGQGTFPAADGEDTAPAPVVNAPCVLVADDNPDMRAYLTELLRKECNVLAAADGLEAWDLLQRNEVDVVVSDVMMPGLDGLALTAQVKASPALSCLPVILVTARGGAEASILGLDGGADDYLAKPFSPQELRARVRAALRMRQVQRDLHEKSREAGIAMLASSVLHNLGNVLNGVTVSSGLALDRLHQSRVTRLRKVAELLHEHANNLPAFFANDNRAQALPELLARLAEHLEAEQKALLKEIDIIRDCAEHASGVIASRQELTRPSTELRQLVSASGLMEAAIKLGSASFEMHGITIERDYIFTGSIAVDRHKVLQIIMNLLSNAHHALCANSTADRRIRMRTSAGRHVLMEVSDNGAGIDPRYLPLLFNQGFTTKRHGHGYGLHSSANWARELGGVLTCHSDGLGRGATFTLKLPFTRETPRDINVGAITKSATA